ncbi:MAG: hypothetical protein V5A43_09295 [Haloarculaceae archaeon]
MYELVLELLVEFGSVVGVGLAATGLAALGLMSELAGYARVTSGQTLGFWFLFMGLVALVAAYKLTVDELIPRFHAARARRSGTESG